MMIQTPGCPLCSAPPAMTFGPQAFCGNDDCDAILWDATMTLDENLLDAGVARFTKEGEGP